jgi:hypothetical protein
MDADTLHKSIRTAVEYLSRVCMYVCSDFMNRVEVALSGLGFTGELTSVSLC